MTIQETDISSLLGSRICHDLISPIGAIDNGLELLAMGPGSAGPEIELIAGSVGSAKARILYYRIAFGIGDERQSVGESELASVVTGYTAGMRMSVSMHTGGDVPRIDAKAACLLLMCCEAALPFGGHVDAKRAGGIWRFTAVAEKMNLEPAPWSVLTDVTSDFTPTPKYVQFTLAAQVMNELGRRIDLDQTPQGFILTA